MVQWEDQLLALVTARRRGCESPPLRSSLACRLCLRCVALRGC
jgi:hypothetical protein